MVVMCALVMSMAQPVFAAGFWQTAGGIALGAAVGGALVFFTGGAAVPFITAGLTSAGLGGTAATITAVTGLTGGAAVAAGAGAGAALGGGFGALPSEMQETVIDIASDLYDAWQDSNNK